MSFWEVFVDVARPQAVKDIQQLDSIAKAVRSARSKPSTKAADELRATLKKGWLARVEKALFDIGYSYDSALRTKIAWPREKIDECEKEVLTCYKLEKKRGYSKVEMKATQAAIKALLKELDRHIKDLKDSVATSSKVPQVLDKLARSHKDTADLASALEKEFKPLVKMAVFTAYQAELTVNMLHCADITRHAKDAHRMNIRLAAHQKDIRRELLERLEMAVEQYRTVKSSAYWEDLENMV